MTEGGSSSSAFNRVRTRKSISTHSWAVVGVILAVIVAGALVFLFAVLGPATSGGTSIASALSFGNPVVNTCAPGSAFALDGCAAGDVRVAITVASSSVTFAEVAFQVTSSSSGSVAVTQGGLGFTVFNASNSILAQFVASGGYLGMNTSAWQYGLGVNASTVLTDSDVVVIDMGSTSPAGLMSFDAAGVGGGFGSTTTPVSLL